MRRQVIHDPLYGPIYLDAAAVAIINTPEYQRLRRIKQLSTASIVYPGAVHTRFEHAVGVYHLARTILGQLADRGELAGFTEADVQLITLANLVHDVAHHGGSAHTLEQTGVPGACHEAAAERFYTSGELGAVLRDIGGAEYGRAVARLVRHDSPHPLQGLVSGDADPDKMDYLKRDPLHAGLQVAYDQAWLRSAITLLRNPGTGALEVGIDAAGLPPFEQMLYAKNFLYRNVYFHPVVVAAATMLRSLVITAIEADLVDMEELQEWTDEEVFMALRVRIGRRRRETDALRHVSDLIERLLARRLYEEVASLPHTVAPPVAHGTLLSVERALTDYLGAAPGSVLLDVPHKPTMLSANLLVRLPDGSVRNAATLGPEDGFTINHSRDALLGAAAHVRLYAAALPPMPSERFREALGAAVAAVGLPDEHAEV